MGRCGKSWLRQNGRAQEQGQLLPGLGHTSILPEKWERKVGDVRSQGEQRHNRYELKYMEHTMGMETTKHSEADDDFL